MITLEQLTLREKICQTVIIQHCERYFDKYGSYKEFLKKYPIGGIYRGGPMVNDPTEEGNQSYYISDNINRVMKVPVIYCVDFENGQNEPCQMAIAAANDKDLAYESGVEKGRVMNYYGNHWMFNPVCDIALRPNAYIGVRTMGDKPEKMSELLKALIAGAGSRNVVSTAKHFPGMGVEYLDPHTTKIESEITKQEWDTTHRVIYKKLIEDGLMAVMSTHMALPCYQTERDELGGYPIATFSKELITDLLKNDLGFKGVVVTDSMMMGGGSGQKSEAEIAVDAFVAGHDMILWPCDMEGYVDLMEKKILSGGISMERLDDSVSRILKMKEFAQCGKKKDETPFCFQSVGRKIAEKSVTLINNYNNLFPVNSLDIKKVLLVTASRDKSFKNDLRYIAELLEERGIKVIVEEKLWIPRLLELEAQVDLTIFAIYEGVSSDMPGPVCITGDEAVNIWASQKADPQKTVIASFGSPFVYNEYYRYFPTYVNMYSPVADSCEAFVKALFGEIECTGISPVKL